MNAEVLVEIVEGEGRLVLNRPRAINALTVDMLVRIGEALVDWTDDERVERVRLTGAGDRGLCSGADVRALREQVLAGSVPARFFEVEYAVDDLIARYPKPFRADLRGIVMGGGLGLSAHAAERVVTPGSRLAMPETVIGFFPDVGVLWELSRAPGELGTHLALTGEAVNATDAVLVGLADRCAGPAPAGVLADQRHWIDQCYAGDDPVAIISALADHPDPRARAGAAELRRRCPFSLWVTLAALRRAGAMAGVSAVLAQDAELAVPMVLRPDFAEGVRAQVVDKDRAPRWRHPGVEDVDPAEVAALFA